jgi:signal transduction histidine kinase
VGLTLTNGVFLLTGAAAPNLVLGLALTAAVAILVPRRLFSAHAADRPLLLPAVVATLVTLLVVGLAIVVELLHVPEPLRSALRATRDVGVLAIPLGFVFGSFQLARQQLQRSRARIVTTAITARQHLERDPHDGAQQRLIGVAVAIGAARRAVETLPAPDAAAALDLAATELRSAIDELRELARGIHPAVLTQTGLAGALPSLAERSTLPTTVEAADPSLGSGMLGMADRVAALGGHLGVISTPGRGTDVTARIPVHGSGLAPWTRESAPLTMRTDDDAPDA